jgi:hypothetical protein
MASRLPLRIRPARRAVERVRPQAMPIVQTAVAAVVAWYLALALPLHDSRPVLEVVSQ